MKLMRQLARVISVLSLVLTLGVGIGLAQEKSANYWFNRAFQEPNIDKKIEHYRKSIQLDPQNPDAHNNLGVLYKKKGMYAEAIKEYEAALAVPNYETSEYAYHNLGVLYKDRAMYKQAIDYFKQAIQTNPQFIKAYNGLGLAYKGLGRYEEATDSFNQALKLNPNYVQASYNLQKLWRLSEEDTDIKRQAEMLYDEGVRLLEQKEPQAAIAKLQEALKLNPQHVGAKEKLNVAQNRVEFNKWYKLGENSIAQRQWKQASSYFNQASNYAASAQERQRIAARQREVRTQLQLQARRAEVDKLYRQGINSLNNKAWLQAISKFTKVLMLEPQHKLAQEKNELAKAGYYYEKGLGSLKVQRWQAAEESFNDVLQADPQHAGAQEQLKIIAEHRQQEKINLLLQQAEQARKLNDLQTTEQMYQRILELDGNHAEAQAGLESIRQLAEEDTKRDWMSYLSDSIWPISFIVIALAAGCLVFAKIIRPSQVINHYLKYKEYDKTKTIYEKILEKDDNRRSIYPSLANIYIKLKCFDGVEHLIQLCQQKIQQAAEPEIPLWHLALGEIYQHQEKLAEAQQEMELAYEKQPQNEDILQKLASLYSAILNLGTEDTQIATKLEKLNAKLTAKAKPGVEVSLLPAEVNSQPTKVEKEADEDHALQLLKECFGDSKS